MHRSKQALIKSRPGKCTAGERRIERGGGLECSRLGRHSRRRPGLDTGELDYAKTGERSHRPLRVLAVAHF